MEEIKEKNVEENTKEKTEYEIVGVKFKSTGKMYYFDASCIRLEAGDCAIVETSRGVEYGFITLSNRMMPTSALVLPLRPVLRKATSEDTAHYEENRAKEADAAKIFEQKIAEHKLEMKLVDVEYTFDNSKLLFYFTSDGRVDFRELVKDLASVFRTRIELRQIGIRDETKMIGGIGMCGRPYCCKKFLDDFAQVSIKMAKEQNLSLNSQKISGACGRLMCCLRYEHDAYEDALKNLPKVDSTVKTPDGVGTVFELVPLAGIVKVKFPSDDQQGFTYRQYPADSVTPVRKND